MSESPQEREEKARVRRRWLTLGEILGIAAVAISALTFWNSYRERTNAETEHATESAAGARKAAVLVLKATPSGDGKTLALAPRSDTQAIQAQTVRFPAALGLAPVETTSDARIERGWFADALVRARKEAGLEDKAPGDARLPVLIVTRYLADGDPHTDRTVYELGYATEHGFLSGTSVKLRGLARSGAAADDARGQARIDAEWKAMLKP